ncbi:M1 family metallopeptidase [Caulobacter sp. BP25]|uniref:M1 family metallopeptidase n=1 Tax=Caulobacter sp. BP25 TaxID=2048900 RepID=UPI000C12CE4D|nr:M1 family metallopeptidase [Caulobacter sp. BP25]PHY19193.1 aminopeptidase [Caulobacter sp. BP25]
MRRLLSSTAAAVILLAAGGACAANAPPAAGSKGATFATVTTQLPRNVRPSHYDLAFTPDADKLSFTARVKISIEVVEPTRTVTLQAADLTFDKAQIAGPDGKTIGAAKVKVDAEAQTASFTFDKPLPKGKYVLAIDYAGKIYTQAAGLFALDYETETGKKRALYTQFENSDARRFIPSWDEPFYKATYSVEATVPTGQMALSNMPVAASKDIGGGKTLVTFATSPKMSTYLLFFGLGEFDRASVKVAGVDIGVVTKKGDNPKAQFALKSAADILPWYNDYFGTPYPLPVMDNIAAPGRSQFFSAMENWGAIFYFEYAMLLDPKISTDTDRQDVFTTVAHEMAHQWFGDLVTMAWWDDLWLNEGFASWMEGRASEHFHPEWNSALAAVGGREYAMSLDALSTTHPVVQHVETVEQASQAFDGITYQKGEAVIRMLESYVGHDAWRDGVRAYMKKHAHGNTVSDDLWSAIEASAKKPIKTIAHDFTLQPGVPLITVDSATCAAGKTTLSLTQGEFSKDRPGKTPLVWRTPVTVKALGNEKGGGGEAKTLVTGGKGSVSVEGCGPVVVNAGQSGYFRVQYGPERFAGIARNFAKLPSIDQLGVMSDAWSMGLAGYQPATDFLELAKATPADADPQVLSKITGVYSTIDAYYEGMPAERAAFRKLAIAKLRPLLAAVGWTAKAGEPDNIAILRANLIGTLGGLGDADVVAEAIRRFNADKTDPTAIPGPLRKAILGVVSKHADPATWEAIRAQAQTEKTPLVKAQLYSLLAATEDEALAKRALELALTPEPGETMSSTMISRVARNFPDMTFDWAVANKDAVNAKVDTSSRTRFIPGLGSSSSNPAMADRIRAYAAANLAEGSRKEAEISAASVLDRAKIRQDRLPAITAWVAKAG